MTVTEMYLASCAPQKTALKCVACDRVTNHISQCRIVRSPKVLLVQVKRQAGQGKVPVDVEELLELPGLCAMQLASVIYHDGFDATSGHYTCVCRGPGGRFWYYDDDRAVEPLTKEVGHVKPREVCMLAYCAKEVLGQASRGHASFASTGKAVEPVALPAGGLQSCKRSAAAHSADVTLEPKSARRRLSRKSSEADALVSCVLPGVPPESGREECRLRAAGAAEQRAAAFRARGIGSLRKSGKSSGRLALAVLAARAATGQDVRRSGSGGQSSGSQQLQLEALQQAFGMERYTRVILQCRAQVQLGGAGDEETLDPSAVEAVLLADMAADLDVDVERQVQSASGDAAGTRWGRMQAALPSLLAEGILVALQFEYKARAQEILALESSWDWAQWDELVEEIAVLGLSVEDPVFDGQVLARVRCKLRAHVRLASQNAHHVCKSDQEMLRELEEGGLAKVAARSSVRTIVVLTACCSC